MKRVLSFIVLSSVVCMTSLPSQASRGFSVSDQILTDYRNSKTFQEFVEKLTRAGAGDYLYVQGVWKVYPEILKNTSLPKLNYDKSLFVLREGLSEIRLAKAQSGHFQYLINGKVVQFNLYDLPTQKMKKIMAATQGQKAARVVLMPVAWAATQGQPSKLDLAAYGLVNVLMDDEGIPIDQKMWDRAETERFIADQKAALQKSVGEKCLREIEIVERAFVVEKAPLEKMSCEGKSLAVALKGVDSDGFQLRLNFTPDKLVVHRQQGKKEAEGALVFVRRSTDEENYVSQGYGEDQPVAATSSPFQRDHDFHPKGAKEREHIEYLDRFIGLAGDADIRDICGTCSQQVNEYARLIQAYEAKTMSLKRASPAKGRQ